MSNLTNEFSKNINIKNAVVTYRVSTKTVAGMPNFGKPPITFHVNTFKYQHNNTCSDLDEFILSMYTGDC